MVEQGVAICCRASMMPCIAGLPCLPGKSCVLAKRFYARRHRRKGDRGWHLVAGGLATAGTAPSLRVHGNSLCSPPPVQGRRLFPLSGGCN
jgi:hypothetical protein